MSSKQLLLQAGSAAAELRARASAGKRVLLIHDDSAAFIRDFFACLWAGLIPVPATPPHPARANRVTPRLRAIAADTAASLVLTSAALEESARRVFDGDDQRREVLVTAGVAAGGGGGLTPWAIDPDGPAYLQYTSGSTASPRGVKVSHANVLNYLRQMSEVSGFNPSTVLVAWLPLFHDMGLISSVIFPLFLGCTSVIMSPLAFLQRPLTWLEAIDRHRATETSAPNFAYDLAVARTTAAERDALDLRTLRTAYNGGEPIRADSLDSFATAFANAGLGADVLRPSYGLAEAVLTVSTTGQEPPTVHHVDIENLRAGAYRVVPEGTPGSRPVVACGRPLPGQRLEIVDPLTRRPCPPRGVGEIWISGASVSEGYWATGEESAGVFAATLDGEDDGARFLRTGDLGAIHDGQLCVVGRLKDVIILGGENYYPQDIELATERAHSSVRRGCVAATRTGALTDEKLLVVAEIDIQAAPDLGLVIEDIRRAVGSTCGIQVAQLALVEPRTLPKTSSGKLQRGAAGEAFMDGTLRLLASWERS